MVLVGLGVFRPDLVGFVGVLVGSVWFWWVRVVQGGSLGSDGFWGL